MAKTNNNESKVNGLFLQKGRAKSSFSDPKQARIRQISRQNWSEQDQN